MDNYMNNKSKYGSLYGGFLEGKHNIIGTYDSYSAYPAIGIEIDDAPNLFNPWHLHFYKMPMGVICSNLKKDGILFEIGHSKTRNEKIVNSQIGDFYFRKGGKSNSWLCYKYVD